jgi:ubiquinone/menaquinone biosynthesis C-methylase UbiE
MGFYDDRILPHVINVACGAKPIRYQRKKVVPHAEGRVLEIGMGSGLNIQYYDPAKVEFVWGLEPSTGMRRKAQANLAAAPFEVKWLDLPGEEIPLDDDTVDTVLLTYTLCTIPGWQAALEQMRRVLKPGGKLLFCEHGQAPDEGVRNWQNRLNGVWGKVTGGCNINRPVPDYLEQGGFKIEHMETMYVPSTPKIAAFTYWGNATAA